MNNIWSNNKYVNLTINVLLFLLGINIFHYGQLLLPIICLILFIDNKFKFVVNNKWIFAILCLFAISFFAFSYEQGFYSVMAFCLPMAYYIGSNIKVVNEDNIKKVIYLITLGMVCHIMLNFVVDIITNGTHLFYSSTHYDIWISGKVTATTTLTNCIPLVGFLFYILKYEKNTKFKYAFLVIMLIIFIYNFGLGQRTLYAMIAISLLVAYLLEMIFSKRKINIKKLFLFIVIIFIIICIFVLCYFYIEDFKFVIDHTRIFVKLFSLGMGSNRFTIFIDTVKLVPYHLFGGCSISEILGIMPHDLWLDVYNWAGIIPYALLLVHTILFIIVMVKTIKNNKISNSFKIFIIPMFVCIGLQCLLEPIMSGASLFLIIVIIFESLIEKMNYGK